MSFFFLLLAASLLSSWWLISKAFLTGTFVLGMLQLLVQSGYAHVFLTPEKFSFLANRQCDAADLSFQTLPKRVPRAPRTSRLLSSFFIFPKILMTPKKEPTSGCPVRTSRRLCTGILYFAWISLLTHVIDQSYNLNIYFFQVSVCSCLWNLMNPVTKLIY